MSIQSKVISLIAIVLIVYLGMDRLVQKTVILPSFVALEHADAKRNMQQVSQAIDRELELLGTKATDWATWDDTYRFARDQNQEFMATNLNAASLMSLKVSAIYIFNSERQLLWGLAYDVDHKQPLALEGFAAQLSRSKLTASGIQGCGILPTAFGPMLLASRPILTSSGGGPTRGAVIIGQLLNAKTLANQTKSRLTITLLNSTKLTADQAAIIATLKGAASGQTILRRTYDTTRIYSLMPDIFAQPALLLEVELPRAISTSGRTAIDYAMLSLFLGGLVVILTLIAGLHWIVLNPLSILTRHAVGISQSGELDRKIVTKRHDELGQLAQEFNRMTRRLKEARENLAEQSFSAGVAEMARGVLHNIGNAITPLNVKICTLIDELRQAPVAELSQAEAELNAPATVPARRADLEQFVKLAGLELAELVNQSLQELEQARKQIEHIQLILNDQQRFSRTPRALQPLSISDVVNESIELLADDLRNKVRIDADPSLERLGSVQAARIALQQVITNLLINAAESIESDAQRNRAGQISILGDSELVEGLAMAHLRFEDNGAGIPSEKLNHIFERDFSTKRRGSGLGLHWSANTVAAFNGRLYAESAGPGQGAVFHMLLPLTPASGAAAELEQ